MDAFLIPLISASSCFTLISKSPWVVSLLLTVYILMFRRGVCTATYAIFKCSSHYWSWYWRRDIFIISSFLRIPLDEWYFLLISFVSHDNIGEIWVMMSKKSSRFSWTHAKTWELICIGFNLYSLHTTSLICIGVTTATILYRSQFRYGTVWVLQWERHLVRTGYRRWIHGSGPY